MNVKNIIQKIISFFISLFFNVSDGQEPDENPAQPDAQDKDIDDPWGYPAEVYRKCAKEIYDPLKLIVDKITNA